MTYCNIGYLGTSDISGKPHLTPVVFVYDGHNLFFSTSNIAKKHKNIKENSNIAFLVDARDPLNIDNNLAVLIQGKAKIYDRLQMFLHPLKVLRIIRLFYRRYPKYMVEYKGKKEQLPKAWRISLLNRIFIRIDPTSILYWRGVNNIKSRVRVNGRTTD